MDSQQQFRGRRTLDHLPTDSLHQQMFPKENNSLKYHFASCSEIALSSPPPSFGDEPLVLMPGPFHIFYAYFLLVSRCPCPCTLIVTCVLCYPSKFHNVIIVSSALNSDAQMLSIALEMKE